jgi:peptidoglycan biosynthesis protein MviN/MurJ (putative lipid II flippase)
MRALSALAARVRSAHPDHHAIARGMGWVAVFVFIGKLVGAAKEMAVAYRYGVSAEVDAYLFVFNLINWPVSLWFSVLSVVLLPLAARIRQVSAAEIPVFRAELLGISLALGGILTLLVWLGLSLLLRSSWTGLPVTTVAIAVAMAPALSWLAPMGVVISLFSTWTMAAGRHFNTLLEGLPALILLIAVLAFPGGIESLVWGTLVGSALHLASLSIPLSKRKEIERPRFSLLSHYWPIFLQGFSVMLLGQAMMSPINIIDQFFAAQLGSGAIATLGYANRIVALVLGLGATAVGRATLPVFSMAQVERGEQTYCIAMHWVRLLFTLGVLSMLASLWVAPWAVGLLFERGAFTPDDTKAVAEVLRFGLIQVPFYFAGLLLVSLLASQRKHKLIAIGAGVNLIVKIFANFILVPLMGIGGINVATAIMYLFSFAMLCSFAKTTVIKLEDA